MMQGQETLEEGCRDWLEPRYEGVHYLMVRLLGRCTCQSSREQVHRLYSIAEATEGAEPLSA
jgi:hypothetical protein